MRPAATGAPPIGSPYDIATLRQLNALTSQFYERKAASFSATRQAPWRGWSRALDIIAQTDGTFGRHPLAVLDLACGNLRFERFLAERSAGPLSVIALDNCGPLVAAGTPHADGAPRTGAEAEGGRGAEIGRAHV